MPVTGLTTAGVTVPGFRRGNFVDVVLNSNWRTEAREHDRDLAGPPPYAAHAGTDLFRIAAAVFFIGLLAAWITVAPRTAYGTWTGELLR